MKNYFEVLRQCQLFHETTDENLMAMLECLDARIAAFHKKKTILAEGEPARYIGIVLSGEAQVIRVDYFGNRSIVANVQPSEIFGESFACADVRAIPVDVIATEDTEVMLIDCLRILRYCSKSCEFHRQMIYNLMKIVAKKNLLFHQKIEITSKRSTKEKLMAYLLLQAKKNKSSSFEIPFSRQELADYLEVERTGLSAEISKLCRQGVITANKRRFQILRNENMESHP